MALKTLMTFATILSIIMVSESAQREQNKPGPLYKLCGNDFTGAFYDCCKFGYPACASMISTSSEGGIEVLEKRGHPLIPSRVAKNFMGAFRKRGWGDGNSGTHVGTAVEECCNESGAIEEILEYGCW